MKKGTLRRLAALFVCLAMLLSGLSFADEVGGGSSEPVEQSTNNNVEQVVDNSNTSNASVSEESDPGNQKTPDIVVSEGNETVPSEDDPQPEETEKAPAEGDLQPEETEKAPAEGDLQPEETEKAPAEGDPQPDKTEKVPSEDDPQPDETEKVPAEGDDAPEDPEQNPEGDPNDPDADLGLETPDDMIATLQAKGEAVPIANSTECKHEKGDELVEEDRLISYSVTPTHHQGLYEHVEYYRCKYCNKIMPETYECEEVEGDKKEHDWENGECKTCDYVCNHPGAEVSDWATKEDEEPWYSLCDNTYHIKNTTEYRTVSCDTCKMKQEEQERDVEIKEAHQYDSDGVCELCDHAQETLPTHKHEDHWIENDYEITFSDYDKNNTGPMCLAHTRTTTITYICGFWDEETGTMCGVENPETKTEVSTGNYRLEHVFDEYGVCVNCRQSPKNCTHPNRISQGSYVGSYDSALKVESCGNGSHKGTMIVYHDYYCPDCGVYFHTSTKEENVIETCTFDDGKCTICGYEETSDTENLKDEDECTHPVWLRDEVWTSGSGNITTKSDWTHTYQYTDTTIFEYCAECNKQRERTTTDKKSKYTEQHDFEYGQCVVCGAKEKECTHPDKYRVTNTYDEYYDEDCCGFRNLNEAGHTRIYEHQVMEECDRCWAILSYTTTMMERTEPHNYDIHGVCEDCGWSSQTAATCKHEAGTKSKKVYEQDEHWAYYEEKNAKQHIVYGRYKEYQVCAACGVRMPNSEVEQGVSNGTLEDHDFVTVTEDGLRYQQCTKCYYTTEGEEVPCAHPNLKSGTKLEDRVVYEARGDEKHDKIVTEGWICPDCKQSVYLEDAKTTTTEDHSYDKEKGDGVCPLCKHQCSDAVKVDDPNPKVETTYKEEDDQFHTVVVTTTTDWTCKYCGKKGTYDPDKQETPGQKHHYDDDGVCSECEHTCAHSSKSYGAERHEFGQYLPDNDDTHTPYDTVTTPWTCDYCEIEGEDVEKDNPGTAAAHQYELDANGKDYVCSDCGYTCKHKGAKTDKTSVPEYVNITDETHDVVTTITTTITCDHGHDPIVTTETKTETGVKHSYENGVCKLCQHECAHELPEVDWEKNKNVTMENITVTEIEDNDAEHQIEWDEVTTYTCPYCKQEADETSVHMTDTEAHDYIEGQDVCAAEGCGHVCMHSDVNDAVEEHWNDSYKSNGSKGHSHTYDVYMVVHCKYCGLIPEGIKPELIEEGVTVANEKHNFKNGKCALCGYVMPASTEDDKQAEVSDEPVFEPVAPGTQMHGVTVGDGSRMATTLGKAVEGIQAEYGADVGIFVRDADKILTPVEYKTLNALPVQEQILVVLTALGYRDEVTNGLEELGIELSREAHGLIGQIALRLAGMSEAEKAEFMELLAKYFQATVDASEQHTEIVLEIRVKLDEGYRLERYSFDLKDGMWQFAALAIAGAE